MIYLIGGATHAGKTLLAQRLMERLAVPYLSMDHLKMGLIRSGSTFLTPTDSHEALTRYLWPILREMIKTAIENGQSLIVEGCYLPFSWQHDFESTYLSRIHTKWLILHPEYIRCRFSDIQRNACIIERRLDDSDLTPDLLIQENLRLLQGCQAHGCKFLEIREEYPEDLVERFLMA